MDRAQTYCKIQAPTGQSKVAAIKTVSVPEYNPNTQQTTWRRLTATADINNALIHRNEDHFSQVEGTPPTIEPFLSLSGRNAKHSLHHVQATQLSVYNQPTQELYLQLTKSHLPQINTNLSTDQVKAGYQKWKETTTTSPSGRHLSHFKVLLQANQNPFFVPSNSANPKTHAFPTTLAPPINNFFESITILLNLCSTLGIALQCWYTVHCIMLEKKIGVDKIDKVRVMHIMESDLNLLLGVAWNCLMNNSEYHNALNDNQWGSWKGRQCIQVVQLKQFSYKIACYTRTDMITLNNDAKSCYDRIVML